MKKDYTLYIPLGRVTKNSEFNTGNISDGFPMKLKEDESYNAVGVKLVSNGTIELYFVNKEYDMEVIKRDFRISFQPENKDG